MVNVETLRAMMKNRIFLFTAGPLALLVSLFGAYLLHAYVSLALSLFCAAALFKIGGSLGPGRIEKGVLYACGFTTFLLMLGLPAGDIGITKCPQSADNLHSATRIYYFSSPFCPHCLGMRAEFEKARGAGANFSLREYDIRYCRAAAEYFGFAGTPCFAVNGSAALIKHCGPASAGEIAGYVKKAGGAPA